MVYFFIQAVAAHTTDEKAHNILHSILPYGEGIYVLQMCNLYYCIYYWVIFDFPPINPLIFVLLLLLL